MSSEDAAGALIPQRRAEDLPNRFRGAQTQIRDAATKLQSRLVEPEVRKWWPAAAAVGLVGMVLASIVVLNEPERATLYAGLPEADKAAVVESLKAANFDVTLDPATGSVQVPSADVYSARMALAAEGLPEAAPSGYELLDNMPFGSSRQVEQARLQQTQETELARSIAEISGVDSARVHLAVPAPSAFVRDNSEPTASVFLRLKNGRVLDNEQVMAIVHLVSSSVPGLGAANVSVVDQRGTLLSSRNEGMLGETSQQLAYRTQLEQLWRDRINAILVPMFGLENFSAEVALDLDFSVSESTSETFDKDGAVLRSEQGSVSEMAAADAARGVPGALTNQAPPAAELEAAGGEEAAAEEGEAGAPAAPTDRDENYVRNYEIGKQVSVSRTQYGDIKRASIAVVLREGAGTAEGVKMTAEEMKAVETLIAGAVGLQPQRGDMVVVRSRPFAPTDPQDALPLWKQDWVLAWAGKGVLLILGLAALFLLGRPAMQILKARAAPPEPLPSSEGDADGEGEEALALQQEDYEARLALLRQLVASDLQRASMAVSDLMKTPTNAEASARG